MDSSVDNQDKTEAAPSPVESIRDAGPPFNNEKADVILRSSDSTPMDFRVFKSLLSLASPFFEGMFTLPQPTPEGEGKETGPIKDGIPVVPVTEDSKTLQWLLELCYPISIRNRELTPINTLEDVQSVMDAARKYEMEGVKQHMRQVLMGSVFVEKEALRVFAIACRYGLKNDARLAAIYTLLQPDLVPSVKELEYISGATYHRLREFRQEMKRVMMDCLTRYANGGQGWEGSWIWFTAPSSKMNIEGELVACKCQTFTRKEPAGWRSADKACQWWVEWTKDVGLELSKTPWPQVVKRVDLMEVAVTKAISCRVCEPKAKSDLQKFSVILARELQEAVKQVCGSSSTKLNSS